MGSKWRGIAKKGKRRDVGLLEPTNASMEEKPVPYMPALDKQRGPAAGLQTPSPSENHSGAVGSSQELDGKSPVSLDTSRAAASNSEPKKCLPSTLHKNSIPVAGSNASYGKYGRNSIKVNEKQITGIKNRKKSFDDVLDQMKKSTSRKSKSGMAESGVKKTFNDRAKGNSHAQSVKEKSTQNDRSKIDEIMKKVEKLKSLDDLVKERDRAPATHLEDGEPMQIKKPKKKKCGFMRPSQPKKESKSSFKIMQSVLDFTRATQNLPDIASLSSEERCASEKKITQKADASASSSHKAAVKSRSSVNKISDEKSKLNITEGKGRESPKTSRRSSNIKKFNDRSNPSIQEQSSKAPVEVCSSSSGKNYTESSHISCTDNHHSERKAHRSNKRRNRKYSSVDTSNSIKVDEPSSQCSPEFKCNKNDSSENQTSCPASLLQLRTKVITPSKASFEERMNCDGENAHKNDETDNKETHNVIRHRRNSRTTTLRDDCKGTPNLNKERTYDAVMAVAYDSKETISSDDQTQKQGERTATVPDKIVDKNDAVREERTHRGRTSKPHLPRDRISEPRTRSCASNLGDSTTESVDEGETSSSVARKRGGARHLRSQSLSGKHKVSVNDTSPFHKPLHSADLCQTEEGSLDASSAASHFNSAMKVNETDKDNVKPERLARNIASVAAIEELSNKSCSSHKKPSDSFEKSSISETKGDSTDDSKLRFNSCVEMNSIQDSPSSVSSASSYSELERLQSALPSKCAAVQVSCDNSDSRIESTFRKKGSLEYPDKSWPVNKTKGLVVNVTDEAGKARDSKSLTQDNTHAMSSELHNLEENEKKGEIQHKEVSPRTDTGISIENNVSICDKTSGKQVSQVWAGKGENVEQSLDRRETISDGGKSLTLSPERKAKQKPVAYSDSKKKKRVRLDRSSFNESDKIKEVVEEIIKETSPQKVSGSKSPVQGSMSPTVKLMFSDQKSCEKMSKFSSTRASSSVDPLSSLNQSNKSEPVNNSISTSPEVDFPNISIGREELEISYPVDSSPTGRLQEDYEDSSLNKPLKEPENMVTTESGDTWGKGTCAEFNEHPPYETGEIEEKLPRAPNVEKYQRVADSEVVNDFTSSKSSISECDSNCNSGRSSLECTDDSKLLHEEACKQSASSRPVEAEQETKVISASREDTSKVIQEGSVKQLHDVEISSEHYIESPKDASTIAVGTECTNDNASLYEESELKVSKIDVRKSEIDLNKKDSLVAAVAKANRSDSPVSDSVPERNWRRSSLRSRRSSTQASTTLLIPATSVDTAVVLCASAEPKPSVTEVGNTSVLPTDQMQGGALLTANVHLPNNCELGLPQRESGEKSLHLNDKCRPRIELGQSESSKEVAEKSDPVDTTGPVTSSVPVPNVSSDARGVDESSITRGIIGTDQSEVNNHTDIGTGNTERPDDATTTSGVSELPAATLICPVNEVPQEKCTSKSDGASSEDSDTNEEPTARVLRGRVIEPKKGVVPKTSNLSVSLNSNQNFVETPESLCVQLKPVVRLFAHAPLHVGSKTATPSRMKKSKGLKHSVPEMKDCLIVPPPPTRLPVLVTDDRKAVAMDKRQRREQLVLVVNIKRDGILGTAYLEDGKMMRYPLRKSKASDTPVPHDSLSTEGKELLKVASKEKDEKIVTNKDTIETEAGDWKSAVPVIKTKNILAVDKLEITGPNTIASMPEKASSRSSSPVVKIHSKIKQVNNDQKPLTDPEAAASRGSTPQPPIIETAETSQSRSKRQPKASQKLLESFESGSFDLFKNMSKPLSEKPSNDVSVSKSKEKLEDEVSTSKPKDKHVVEDQILSKESRKDVPANSTENLKHLTSSTNPEDSGSSKDVAVQKKRPLEEDGSYMCSKKKKRRKEDVDVNTICCGEDHNSSYDLQRHMVKKAREGDPSHVKKLQSSGYDKCTRCPAWIRASMMAVHLQNIHNESSHASTKLQIQTTVIKLKKQTVLGKNIFNESSVIECSTLAKKSYSAEKKPFVDLGERISVSESNINSDENEDAESTIVKRKRGRPALKSILSNKQNVPRNKTLNKKSVTLKSPDRRSSSSDSDSDDSEENSESDSSTSSERNSFKKSKKKKHLKRSACTIDSFDDCDNYKPNAKEGRGLEPLSEHSFLDHSENSRAQIKTKLSLRSSRRCPDTISPLLEKSTVGKRKQPRSKSQKASPSSSSDEQFTGDSDDESSDSDSESCSSTSGDDKENIPLVELDMFTFPSNEFSIFLMDPKNPKLKVYTSLDTIFVSDVSLGNGKKQVSYLTENNNIIYANHNHPVFPNPNDLQSHIPRPLLVMKMTKLGTSGEKNSLTTGSTNVLKDSNAPSLNRQSSTVSKVTELLSELISKSVNKSPRNSKILKRSPIVKSSTSECARTQTKATDENVIPDTDVCSSDNPQPVFDSGRNVHLSPMKCQSLTLDTSSSLLHSTRKSIALESTSVSKSSDSLPHTPQYSTTDVSNPSHERTSNSLNSACGVDLLQQVISSTISSPLSLEAYSSLQLDSFGDIPVVDPNSSSKFSADEVVSYCTSSCRDSKVPNTPTVECESPKKISDDASSPGKNVHVIRKALPHSLNKIILKASGMTSSNDTQCEFPTKIQVTRQTVQTATTSASDCAPTPDAFSAPYGSSPVYVGGISPKACELSNVKTTPPPSGGISSLETKSLEETPKIESSSLPTIKEGATSSCENSAPQQTSKPQKSTWSFLDDDSDEFLATLEFTDTLQSPSCLDSSEGNYSSDSRHKDLISAVKLPEKLPSLVIGDEDFENVFDESHVTFVSPSIDKEADPVRNDSPKLEKLNSKSMKEKSPCANSPVSLCQPEPVTEPLESSSRPTFISPPSRKRLQCFDESDVSSPSRTYSKLAYSALSDNDIFGLWPSNASPKVSLPGSPVKEVVTPEKRKKKLKDSPVVKLQKSKENRSQDSPSNSHSPCYVSVSDEKTALCNESEQNNEISSDVLSSTLVSSDCNNINTPEKPPFTARRSSTSFSNISAVCPASNSPRDSLAPEVSDLSPVNSGNLTPKSAKIKLAVSFDDGSVPLEFSLDSIRNKDMSPYEISKLDGSLASGSACASANESPSLPLPSGIGSTNRSTPVQFASDDDLGCISGNESPTSHSQLEMKIKKSGRRKEKKSKSKKKKKEKHRHHSPVKPSSDNKGIRMKINLIGMTSEVMNFEAPKPNEFSPHHKVFSPLIEVSKTLDVVNFERPFSELPSEFTALDVQLPDSPASKENRETSPLDQIELIDASQPLTPHDEAEAIMLDEEPEQDPLLLDDCSLSNVKEHPLISERGSVENSASNSPTRRKRKHPEHSDSNHVAKKLKNLNSKDSSDSDGFVSDDASCVSPECLSRDVKPSVDAIFIEKVGENKLPLDYEEKDESALSPRQWLGRGAKLRAAVLIQDQQEGIIDSQVLSSESPILTNSIQSLARIRSPISRDGQFSEPSSPRKNSRSPAMVSVRSRRSSTCVPSSKDSNQISPRHSTPIVRRASADTTTSPDDRTWHSRGAKLKAQVLISDLQSGVENTSVIISGSPKSVSPDSSQATMYSRNDIRYFFQPKKKSNSESSSQSPLSEASGSRPKSDIRSYLVPKNSQVEPSLSDEKKKHHKRSRESDEKNKHRPELPENRYRPIPSASDVNIPVNNLKCWYESRCSRLPISFGGIPLGSGNFVGFDSLEPFSGARAQTLRHVITLSNMKKWSQQSNLYPVPVDQIFDWDEDQLVSELNF